MIKHLILATPSGRCVAAIATPCAPSLQYQSLIDLVNSSYSFVSTPFFSLSFPKYSLIVHYTDTLFCCITFDPKPLLQSFMYSLACFFTSSCSKLYSSKLSELSSSDASHFEFSLSSYSVLNELEQLPDPIITGVPLEAEFPSFSSAKIVASSGSKDCKEVVLSWTVFTDSFADYVMKIIIPIIKNYPIKSKLFELPFCSFHFVYSRNSKYHVEPSLPVLNQVQLFSKELSTIDLFSTFLSGSRLSNDSLSIFVSSNFASFSLVAVVPINLEQGLSLRRELIKKHLGKSNKKSNFIPPKMVNSWLNVDETTLSTGFPTIASTLSDTKSLLQGITSLLSEVEQSKSIDVLISKMIDLKMVTCHNVSSSSITGASVLPPPAPKVKPKFVRRTIPGPPPCPPPETRHVNLAVTPIPYDSKHLPIDTPIQSTSNHPVNNPITPFQLSMEVNTPLIDSTFKRRVPGVIRHTNSSKEKVKRRLTFSELEMVSRNSTSHYSVFLFKPASKQRPIFDYHQGQGQGIIHRSSLSQIPNNVRIV
ncbi:hypothetical protein RCL1_005413 [Eukaryota sp. TZLM3-RCL]